MWEDHSTTFEGEMDGEMEEEAGDGERRGYGDVISLRGIALL